MAAVPAAAGVASGGKGVSTFQVLSAAAAGISGVGAFVQAQQQADILEEQAARERQIAKQEEEDFRERQKRLLASRRALLGGSGVDPSEGSPLGVSQDFVTEAEEQALRIREGGGVRASRLEQQAGLTRTSGVFRAGSRFARGGALLIDGKGRRYG